MAKARSRTRRATKVRGKSAHVGSKSKPKAKSKPVRKRPPPPTKIGNDNPLLLALEYMRDLAQTTVRPTVTLDARTPPQRAPISATGPDGPWHSPWAIVGAMTFRSPVSYYAIRRVLELWLESLENGRNDLSKVGVDRGSRINVGWNRGKGEIGEFTLANVGPLDKTLNEGIARCGDGRDDGLIANYADNDPDITKITVWLSPDDFRDMVARWKAHGE